MVHGISIFIRRSRGSTSLSNRKMSFTCIVSKVIAFRQSRFTKKRSTVGTYDVSFPQMVGAIHVHPNGRTVYMSNRASAVVDFKGKKVFRGGEYNIAAFSIDQTTGEPTLIQNVDPQSFHIRTFSLDPSGRMIVAASIVDMNVRDGDDLRHVPAALTVFRIGEDGKLYFAQKYEVELGGKFQWWAGLVRLAYARGHRPIVIMVALDRCQRDPEKAQARRTGELRHGSMLVNLTAPRRDSPR